MQKVTFALPEETVSSLRRVVADGWVRSQNDLVREAIDAAIRRLRERQLEAEYAAAAKDPMFLRDCADVLSDFEGVDAEAWRKLDGADD